ncbi:hypothetical protein C6H88_02800 [Chlamydia muridarum str. Nigg]|uniref:Uncharacterized protein n=1 Tax=Chlamydia muridarum (strain MoPn / Nigg) TaxID=243161 RepID=Q9PKC5_CHLMU|nr:hypothetical protein [Chlamydia muridarum]UFW37683.1 hypothetical protein FTM86_02925 [Chlamydia trachomatis]AAF39381.1 hypothetical protein TC_0541 [Chlamydia muridarum str. Nigg]AHH22930.1 hypothetical protein TAC_02855 [Chlamydia muridarum str. Nigg3 CMUT3-5]AHH23855.1 hypothetical protein Y015_02855 [Chlamydia muridarum str. Nigg CM972]AIT90723.1 hypothetical protein NC80_02725 [Chlamydia muridarum]
MHAEHLKNVCKGFKKRSRIIYYTNIRCQALSTTNTRTLEKSSYLDLLRDLLFHKKCNCYMGERNLCYEIQIMKLLFSVLLFSSPVLLIPGCTLIPQQQALTHSLSSK